MATGFEASRNRERRVCEVSVKQVDFRIETRRFLPMLGRVRSFPLILVLIAAFTAGCGVDRAEKAADDNILIIGNGGEPKALDPGQVQSVGDSNIMLALFEGLVNYHISDDNLDQPGVAQSWDSNDDFTVWTFYFRGGEHEGLPKMEPAKWSNGDIVKAGDFVFAYKRTLSPKYASPYASMLYFLKNAQEFNEGTITDFAEVGVKALDDFTLECRLRSPTAFFPGVVKHQTWNPVHPPTIEKFGDFDDKYTAWQRPGNHVGNGPFQLKSWRINDKVVVERNPHYWGADKVKLNEIWYIPADTYTEERMFRDGSIHMTYILPPTLIDYYRKNYPEYLREEPYSGSYFYRCNINKPPLDDPKVRRALTLAIDREKIVKFVTRGGQLPATAFTPPIEGVYDPPNAVRFDPVEARRLLAESKYGTNLPKFELLINTSEQHRKIAEAIQDMWRKNLDLDPGTISINNQEWKVFQVTTFEKKYEMARAGWIADYVDPTTFLDMWRTGDSNNNTNWGSDKYDSLLQKAALEQDADQRLKILYQAEEVLLEELPIIPIYWYTRVYALHPRVKNWHPLVLDKHDYKQIYFGPAD